MNIIAVNLYLASVSNYTDHCAIALLGSSVELTTKLQLTQNQVLINKIRVILYQNWKTVECN
jgi:hypothetical protein